MCFVTSNTGYLNVKCEVEFFGRCCVRGRYVRLFLCGSIVHWPTTRLLISRMSKLLMFRKDKRTIAYGIRRYE